MSTDRVQHLEKQVRDLQQALEDADRARIRRTEGLKLAARGLQTEAESMYPRRRSVDVDKRTLAVSGSLRNLHSLIDDK